MRFLKRGIPLLFCWLVAAPLLHAATITRVPTSNLAETGTWTPSAGVNGTDEYATVDDAPGTAAATIEADYITASGAGRMLFNYSSPSVPAGAIITSVNVVYYHQ